MIFLTSCTLRLLIITSAFAVALHVQAPVARADECDKDTIPQDQFEDFGYKGPKEKKPPHKLKPPPTCEGCKAAYDEVVKALDECAKKVGEANKDLKRITGAGTGSATEDSRIERAAKEKIKNAKEDVKKKWEEYKKQTKQCPNAQPGTAPVPPTAPPPGAAPPAPGGGEQPQPGGAAPGLGDEELPKLPPGDCWKSKEERDKFYHDLDSVVEDLTSDEESVTSHGAAPPGSRKADLLDKIKKKKEEAKALRDAADKKKWPCPSPTPTGPGTMLPPRPEQEHGMAPRQPGRTGETCAVLIATGKIKVETSGTGETIGHIADLKIQNLTDQPLTCAVPPMILESGSGKNQHYACPTGQTVALNPHQTKTVPMNGVCLNRNKPPVGKGVSGDLVINEANPSVQPNPDSHIPVKQAQDLLRICTSRYDAADKLQKDGALKDLPYKDKQKQKDIVVQWSTWCDPRISQITGAPPATKEDLRKVVYKQLETKKPMSPETKKKVDQGIDAIFEKVELTTAKAKDLEKPEGETTTEAEPPTFARQQPEYIGQTRAKMPSPTPKSKGGGKTTTKPTPTPTPTHSPTPTSGGAGTTEEKPKETETPAEEKPKAPPPVPSYPYTKEIDCGTITISIGDSGELVFDFKRNDKKCPCKEFGWIQHISPADTDNWRYDNGVLPGVSTGKKIGAKSDPSKPKQPTTPPKGTKLEDWDKNPWYGGTTDKSKPKDFGEHPTPQTHISDKPDAPNVKFITQLVCVETGEVLFSWEWGPFQNGGESPDKVGGGETEPPPMKK